MIDDAYYEERAIHHLKCGEMRTAQVMATLAVAKQLKIMNENNKSIDRSKLKKDTFSDRDVI